MSSVIKSLSVKSKTQSRTRMTRSSRETEDLSKRKEKKNDSDDGENGLESTPVIETSDDSSEREHDHAGDLVKNKIH
ncbi:hypothetical protein CEXT_507391 [Caerostris extrusa]|uniref:Uncharacterized protein n=1 Tax=Caerostris extrusa TaxID=172846 RepID=A0AAV4X3J3_CAEEX|nr:hypothetical protein CEXT_507391 [Caerostris extrusa]